MIESWFVNALIMTGAIGGVLFLNKFTVEKKYHEAMSFISYYFFIFVTLSGLFFYNSDFSNISFSSVWFWMAWAIWDYLNFRTRFV